LVNSKFQCYPSNYWPIIHVHRKNASGSSKEGARSTASEWSQPLRRDVFQKQVRIAV